MEETGLLCTVGGNINWCSHYGQKYGGSSEKIKNRTIIWSSNSTPGYLSKESENAKSKIYMHHIFITPLFIITKIWKQPKSPSIDEWTKKMWYICTMKYYSTIKKEWNLTICDKMVGAGEYYAKWNNSDRKKINTKKDFTYMWNLKNKKMN